MKKQSKNNSLIRIAAMTSMTIFSLLSVFTGTLAWFNANRVSNHSMDQMEINISGNLQTISIYRPTTADVNGYVFSQTPIQTIQVSSWTDGAARFQYRNQGDEEWSDYSSAIAVSMNPDVTIENTDMPDPFTPLSPYHPLLFVFEYFEEVNSTKIYAETNKRFVTPSQTPSGSSLAAQGIAATGNPLSSFIKTYAKGYNSNASIDFSFTSATLSSMQQSSFVTLNTNSAPTFNSAPILYRESNSIKKVALIFEYNAEVIEYIYYYYLSESALDNTITAICDWSLFV